MIPRRQDKIGAMLAVFWAIWLSMMVMPFSGVAQPYADEAPGPCPAAPIDSPEACSGRPLDAPLDHIEPSNRRTLLTPAVVGVAYDAGMVRAGWAHYMVDVVGTLPKGLRVGSNRHLVGVPTQPGAFPVVLVIRDVSHPQREMTVPAVLVVRERAVPTAGRGP